MIKLSDLKNKLEGRPAAVCGGGPSLPSDLQAVFATADAEVIASKQHALYLQDGLQFAVDWICYLEDPDNPRNGELRVALMLSPHAIKVAPFAKWTDVDMDVPWWQGGFSSTLAAWLAGWMGADPILLCGMDCYQGPRKYFYDRPGYRRPNNSEPVANHLRAWAHGLEQCPNADRIRSVSGPLEKVFGRWAAQ